MKKLRNFEEVLYHLKRQEILILFLNAQKFFFALNKGNVKIKSEHSTCVIPLNEFCELYESSIFYLYEEIEEEEEINKEKDDEYYRLWHK